MKKVFYLYSSDRSHISCRVKDEIEKLFSGDGRFSFESGNNFSKDYDAVIVFAGEETLSKTQQEKIERYVNSGGSVVFLCPSINMELIKSLTGLKSIEEKNIQQFSIFVEEKNHYITTRFPNEFQITDTLYCVSPIQAETIFSTYAGKEKSPVVFVKQCGKGKACCVFAGNTIQTWRNFNFRKIVIRSIAYLTGEKQKEKQILCGLVGYGPMFGMGKAHANAINSTTGLKTIAVCDTNPERVEAAKKELPELSGYFTELEKMLKMDELDLIVGIVPHNVHYDVVMNGLEHGKHVVIEKPFCISVDEATKMIEKAKKKNLMLSVFHNRRWDGDYITIKNIVESGLIGEIFHIEAFIGSYLHPRYWWRSDKKISGGVMHDWGAHFLDWILGLVDSKIKSIYGDFQKRIWFSVTNEDHGRAIIRFENGAIADFIISSIAAINKPKWKIWGTKGAIEATYETNDRVNFVSFVSGIKQEGYVKIQQSNGFVEYYRNIADHLLMGEELIVKPEQSRRVIGIIEAAEKSSKTNQVVKPFEDCE